MQVARDKVTHKSIAVAPLATETAAQRARQQEGAARQEARVAGGKAAPSPDSNGVGTCAACSQVARYHKSYLHLSFAFFVCRLYILTLCHLSRRCTMQSAMRMKASCREAMQEHASTRRMHWQDRNMHGTIFGGATINFYS